MSEINFLLEEILSLKNIYQREFETSLSSLHKKYTKNSFNIQMDLYNLRHVIIEYLSTNKVTEAFKVYYYLSIAARRQSEYTFWSFIDNMLKSELKPTQVLRIYQTPEDLLKGIDTIDYSAVTISSTDDNNNKSPFVYYINKATLDEFQDNIIHKHIDNIYYLTVGVKKSQYSKLISDALEVIDLNNKNVGYLHCYADVIATIYEEIILSDVDESIIYSEKTIREHAIQALKYMEEIIGKSDLLKRKSYAKFYSTLSRLQYLNANYESARENMNYAISYEDKKSTSKLLYYQTKLSNMSMIRQLRLMNYKINKEIRQVTKENNRHSEELKEQFDKDIRKSFDSSLMKNLEFIGLFTAILGFLISSITIISEVPLQFATRLIFILFLAFVGSFSLLDLVIRRRKEFDWSILYNLLVALFAFVFLVLLY